MNWERKFLGSLRPGLANLPSNAKKPANVLGEGSRQKRESSILFSFGIDFTGRVKAGQQIETLAGDGHRRAFTPAVILFIALPEEKDNSEPG